MLPAAAAHDPNNRVSAAHICKTVFTVAAVLPPSAPPTAVESVIDEGDRSLTAQTSSESAGSGSGRSPQADLHPPTARVKAPVGDGGHMGFSLDGSRNRINPPPSSSNSGRGNHRARDYLEIRLAGTAPRGGDAAIYIPAKTDGRYRYEYRKEKLAENFQLSKQHIPDEEVGLDEIQVASSNETRIVWLLRIIAALKDRGGTHSAIRDFINHLRIRDDILLQLIIEIKKNTGYNTNWLPILLVGGTYNETKIYILRFVIMVYRAKSYQERFLETALGAEWQELFNEKGHI